ncbi:hypothetical protein EJ06DRAFT_486877 [Trichodelitschia bisporula]|uniref:Zn(2)-C6 fungal-type domain-containing protein n=1 Tax=Trichodelitschia bisporula TaxID=703511 RepID=A0A6G1I854_9PEZI|nr:hypothetical protein EJ06DRAFT_486877 [Trichodelitschia bisporula]
MASNATNHYLTTTSYNHSIKQLHNQHEPPSQHRPSQNQAHLPPLGQALKLPGLSGPDPALSVSSLDTTLGGGEDANDTTANLSPQQPGTSSHPGSASKGPESKRSRACDSCRGLKVKCQPGGEHPQNACRRCAKANRTCIVTPPTKKRTRKTDNKVADLERKLDELKARLELTEEQKEKDRAKERARDRPEERDPPTMMPKPPVKRQLSPSHSPYDYYPPDTKSVPDIRSSSLTVGHDDRSPNKRYRVLGNEPRCGNERSQNEFVENAGRDERGASIYNQRGPVVFDHSDIDGKIDAIISHRTAEHLFDRYVHEFVPNFPAVTFPPGTKASDVRRNKPILFLSILSSTCFGAGLDDDTQSRLEEVLREQFATSMWKNGEKSLELIQSLQVATLWYRPPENFEQHMHYQMVHMSAVMAIDIGMGKRGPVWKKLFPNDQRPQDQRPRLPSVHDNAEARRAWLVCYFLCISITMILRRPILVRFTDYMEDCLAYLETAEDALPSDKILCQHVKLANIAERIAAEFHMDDPAVSLSIQDGKVTTSIKRFEENLADVRTRVIDDKALLLAEHVTNLYLHEIALHSQNNVEDFKTPFTEETFKNSAGPSVLGPHHIQALTACQTSCHKILHTFLSLEIDVIYVLPVLFCVRCIYAMVVMIKLYMAASSEDLANVIKKDDLRIEQYLGELEQRFQTIMSRDARSPHSKFFYVIRRLAEKYQNIKQGKGGPLSRRATPPTGQEVRQAGNAVMQPAQGLDLLSQAAMGNNYSNGAMPANGQVQQPPMVPQAGWYQPVSTDAGGMPMDPNYQYAGGMPMYDAFDYGLQGMNLVIDGAISGLFGPDTFWNVDQSTNMYPQNGGNGGWG